MLFAAATIPGKRGYYRNRSFLVDWPALLSDFQHNAYAFSLVTVRRTIQVIGDLQQEPLRSKPALVAKDFSLNRRKHPAKVTLKWSSKPLMNGCEHDQLHCALHHLQMTAGKENWADIHDPDASWRKKIVGDISDAFIVPRYVRFFYDHFGSDRGASFFEIGSGNGDMSRAMLAANGGQIGRYVVSEYFPEGVKWLQGIGLDAIQADAQQLPLGDAVFDVSLEFDVMHHVPDQRAMAREMMRIARGRCLLTESNGLSIFRKLKELTPGHRAAGEQSFTPRKWRSFFEGHTGYKLTRFEIFPFLFPFKVPKKLLPALVRWNELAEKIPLFRWQCSSVAIYLEYQRT